MTSFDEVVDAWKAADVTHIHPLRNVSDEAYWESGRAQALEAAIWIPEGGSVVDFGCGDGRLSVPLALLGYEVYAVDAAPDMLTRLEQRAEDVSLHTILSDGTTDLAKLIGQQVDVVLARAVFIHHDYESVTTLVNSLVQVLKPGGHLVADWPVSDGPRERRDWIDVTTWDYAHRQKVAKAARLELVANTTPSVWRKQ